jgi:hypothetical protein
LGSLAHEQVASTMHDQHRLLLLALDRHEAHGRPRRRFADRRGISRIVLPALEIGLDVLRWDQAHFVPQPAQLPGPEMGGGASLQADPARRKLREVAQDLPAAEAALLDNGVVCVDTVNLEDVLGQIEANRCNLHGGWLLSWRDSTATSLAR